MKLIPRVFLSALLFTLVISYQNFSSVESNRWDSSQTLKIINEMQNFDKNNAPLPTTLATPSGGSDFESVRDNWMQRQSTLLLNGADKRLEKAVNDKLNSYLDDIKSSMSDPAPATGGTRETAATSPAPVGTQAANTEPEKKKMRQNLRILRVNALKYEFGEASCVDFVADPGNTRLNYSQTLSLSTKMGLEHRSADNLTQMFLRYEW